MNKLLTLAACLILTALLNAQTTIYVKPNGTGDGTSWANACNLEEAMRISASRSLSGAETTEIWVQKGTYYPSKMLIVPDSVKIYGGFAGTENNLSQRNFVANPAIIDGQQKIGSIFRLENSAEINGFTIQNGNANGNVQKNGGGIWTDENCVIENCKIINNVAMLNGGGVYAKGKTKMINSTIENNIANGSGNDMFGNCVTIATKQTVPSPNIISGCNGGIPDFGEISFKSNKIWAVSGNGINQEWSDVVMAVGCNKTTYYGGASGDYYADCRVSSNRTLYGDLFSWCAVARFAHVLCPAPWRAPTLEDFSNLDKAFGGKGDGTGPSPNGTPGKDDVGYHYYNTSVRNQYVNTWGGVYGGLCETGSLRNHGTNAYYWTQSNLNTDRGGSLTYRSNGNIRPQGFEHKEYGHLLRCVR